MEDYLKEIQDEFLEEARDMLDSYLEECLAMTEDKDPKHLEQMFRVLHNIKGTGQSVELLKLSQLAHEIEDYVQNMRSRSDIVVTKDDTDYLFQKYDKLYQIVNKMIQGLPEDEAYQTILSDEKKSQTIEENTFEFEGQKNLEHEEYEEHEIKNENSEENGVLKFSPDFEKSDKSNTANNSKTQSIKCSLSKVEEMLDILGETMTLINTISEDEKNKRSIEKYINQLHQTCLSMKAVPFKTIKSKLIRAVNGACEKTKKTIDFNIYGEHIEVNKFVLETLSDPLVHVLRNSIDHGIEDGEKRVLNNKQERGLVTLSVSQKSEFITIEIKDDGDGIDPERVHQKAIEKGIVDEKENLSDEEKINLILQPGFSTKEEITDLSGRGVGMDVVAKAVENLHGNIKIKSEKGIGSIFHLNLPISQNIYYGLISQVRDRKLVIRTSEIKKIVRLKKNELELVSKNLYHYKIENKVAEVLHLENYLYSNIDLDSEKEYFLILTENDSRLFGVLVDRIDARKKLVEKEIEFNRPNIQSWITTDCFTGVSLLPDSNIGAILNLKGLYTRFIKYERSA